MNVKREKKEEAASGEIYSAYPYADGLEVLLMRLEDDNYVVLHNESYSDDRVGDIWPKENIKFEDLHHFSGRLIFEG